MQASTCVADMQQEEGSTEASDLQDISSGCATIHVLISCIHSQTSEAAPQLPQLDVTGHQLICEMVIVPHMQVVVAACDQLGTIIVEELDGKCEICTGGSATDCISSFHIPQDLQHANRRVEVFWGSRGKR